MRLPKGNLLLVEDNKEVRDWMGGLLSQDGYTVLYAGNGKEAEELAPLADCIFLDLDMPVMTGEEFSKRLRERGHLCPIVIVSAWQDRAMALKRLDSNVTRIITKPFNPSEVLARAEEAMEASRKIDYIDNASTCIRDFVKKERETKKYHRGL